ncbi:MAG: hypothetical protein HYZ15_16735 [Sphingobacteriales bacterium]|nr:hypothetical protein [Sphingobacteriales bacterium]
MRHFPVYLWLILIISCQQKGKKRPGLRTSPAPVSVYYKNTAAIPTPPGFSRVPVAPGSFAAWLRALPLKKEKTVYLYNGLPKKNQAAQFAVVDMPCGKTDLQQCADVVMRLRADYLFETRQYRAIRFTDYEGGVYEWKNGGDRAKFERYLGTVFGSCGSASLEKQLQPVPDFNAIQAGDVLIRGGFPGHAVLVTDIAVNKQGVKRFLLVQGFQPAQDIHLLINPAGEKPGPWYAIPDTGALYTPEWIFYKHQLRRW